MVLALIRLQDRFRRHLARGVRTLDVLRRSLAFKNFTIGLRTVHARARRENERHLVSSCQLCDVARNADVLELTFEVRFAVPVVSDSRSRGCMHDRMKRCRAWAETRRTILTHVVVYESDAILIDVGHITRRQIIKSNRRDSAALK